MTLEEKIARLQNGKPNSLSFGFNEFWTSYETIADAVSDLDGDDFESDEDRQKCIDTNSLWDARWYDNTPVGCVQRVGSTLEIVIDMLLDYQTRNAA